MFLVRKVKFHFSISGEEGQRKRGGRAIVFASHIQANEVCSNNWVTFTLIGSPLTFLSLNKKESSKE